MSRKGYADMKDLIDISEKIKAALSESGVSKYAISASRSQMDEFNAENGEFSLYRTVYSGSLGVTVFKDGKRGAASGNDLSGEGIEKTVSDAISAADAGEPDPAYDIAPCAGREHFSYGVTEPDTDLLFARSKEFLSDIARDYPKIAVMLAVISHGSARTLYENSNGTLFTTECGEYGASIEFSANDGENVTGMDGAGFATDDLSTPFIDRADARAKLSDTEKRLKLIPFDGKFEGTAILTPSCLGEFLSMLLDNYAAGNVILDGTSLWLDKVGQKVADEKLTVSFPTSDPRIVSRSNYTSDGFRAETFNIIEKGVLNGHMLGLYVANKTGRPVVKSEFGSAVVEGGDVTLGEMIKAIDRGIIVGSFSGGHPGTNGEFSGVAKNAFLIEGGKIAGAVSEVMINGNLGEMFGNISGISSETVADGSSVLPYMAFPRIVISGK